MVLGFNHNIRYKGELFHVQTEDSGRANPHIITLLYRGGTIIGSAKTSYADIVTVDQLEQVVESIMKEQHKEMMRRLKGGEFDARLFPAGAPPEPSTPPQPPPAEPEKGAAVSESTEKESFTSTPPAKPSPGPAASPGRPLVAAAAPGNGPGRSAAPATKRSLDEVILDYLITGEE